MWGREELLFLKNDAVCFPSLSFKDRVVAAALAAARRFGFRRSAAAPTGNLANAVAAQGHAAGLDACVFIPPPPRARFAEQRARGVYGARIVRINEEL